MADFERCLQALHRDREQASHVYLDLNRKVLTYLESNHCLDANSCADVVMDRFSEIASEGRVSKPRSLIFSIAWHVLHEYWRNQKRETEAARQLQAELIRGHESQRDESGLDSVKSDCRKSCLAGMPAKDRTLVKRYNEPDGQEKLYTTRKKLANELGVTLSELRKRVFKIRNTLRDCYMRCVSAKGHGQE
jgi:DNA-directed RNA polymerase specialized sigma24 family protein